MSREGRGCWPVEQIDHINRVRNDNRWSNLREANNTENAYNRELRKDNASGTSGVIRARNKWVVRVQVCGVRHNFGFYSDIELAELVAVEARAKYFGEFSV
ncbi:HNH endonuclease [Phytobacter ursingii]